MFITDSLIEHMHISTVGNNSAPPKTMQRKPFSKRKHPKDVNKADKKVVETSVTSMVDHTYNKETDKTSVRVMNDTPKNDSYR